MFFSAEVLSHRVPYLTSKTSTLTFCPRDTHTRTHAHITHTVARTHTHITHTHTHTHTHRASKTVTVTFYPRYRKRYVLQMRCRTATVPALRPPSGSGPGAPRLAPLAGAPDLPLTPGACVYVCVCVL